MMPAKDRRAVRSRHKLRILEMMAEGKMQSEMAAEINMSTGYVSELKKEAVREWMANTASVAEGLALEMAHGMVAMFRRYREIGLSRSLKIVWENDGATMQLEDFEALRKMGDGMEKLAARFGKQFGTDAPVKVSNVTPALSPSELAKILIEGQG